MIEPDGKISRSSDSNKLVYLLTIQVDTKGCWDYSKVLYIKDYISDYNIFKLKKKMLMKQFLFTTPTYDSIKLLSAYPIAQP
ncbi:hypothetical protein SAMN05421544_10926 [Riemerella columbipharyngis]|uniref:Uncharacterized protein n=1 Tax=Riemerella columbipharyngis TaxID=1071918 RepID=A0A1G7CUM3_9FLAO|nr:hypothetical protein SAMN05421544_10926 [Riemerella columbipharyngis]